MRTFTKGRRAAFLAVAAATATLPAVGPAALAAARARVGKTTLRTLDASRELWATIDVCSPKDQPNTVGVRGSMPGDGRSADRLYMRFRLQYMSAANQWVDLTGGAASGYVAVGGAGAAREGGRSFQLVPVAGRPASDLRGVVDFQWRHGASVLAHLSRATAAGHRSVAGADPAGFSAATCSIG